jgi:hypothetical protein
MDNEGNGSCVLEGTSSADPAGYKMDDEVVDSAEPALKRKVVGGAEPARERMAAEELTTPCSGCGRMGADEKLDHVDESSYDRSWRVRRTRPCDGQSPGSQRLVAIESLRVRPAHVMSKARRLRRLVAKVNLRVRPVLLMDKVRGWTKPLHVLDKVKWFQVMNHRMLVPSWTVHPG